MLRITIRDQDASSRIVKLEGKLLEPWIDEVRNVLTKEGKGAVLGLDLSGLSFADHHGAELLMQLLEQGVRIHSCSPFVAELLHWNCKPDP
jgi:hypothetical protein